MIFTQQLGKVEATNPVEAVKIMERHLRYMQEQLEYTLMNLDSDNITEIDTSNTNISSSGGGVTISSDKIALAGKNGEAFNVGYDSQKKQFVFEIKGNGGNQCIYLSAGGEMVITKHTTLSIDSGTWD